MHYPKLTLLATLMIGLAACSPSAPLFDEANLAETQAEAGTTHIAVVAVERWDDVAPSLQPNFNLTAQGALEEVVPITAVLQERFLDALGFQLGVGLPTSSVSETLTTALAADGTETTTGQRVETTAPGTAPSPDTGIPAEAGKPDLPSAQATLEIDPFLRYANALALYQEVQLVNRYVQNAALRYDYVPYFIRLQITVSPHGRHRPYDVYTKLAFFTPPAQSAQVQLAGNGLSTPLSNVVDVSGGEEPLDLPYVVPLLVTDNLEGVRKGRAAEIARQLSLALTATVQGVGAEAGLNKLADDLKQIEGTDLNSLRSVSRLSDNSVQIRLGAARQASVKYETIPRNNYFSLVILVPKAYLENPGGNAPFIPIVAETVWRDAESGNIIAGTSVTTSEARVRQVLQRSLDADGRARVEATGWEQLRDQVSEVVAHVQGGDYSGFVDQLEQVAWTTKYPYTLWLGLADLASESRYHSASVHLPSPREKTLDENQTLVLVDDRRSGMVTLLNDAQGMVPSRMTVTLEVSDSNGARYRFPATNLVSEGGGRAIRLEFPSLAALGVAPPAPNASKLLVKHAPGPWQNGDVPQDWALPNLLYREVAPSTPLGFGLRAAVSSVKAEKGVGTFKLFLDDVSAERVELTFVNGEIQEATSTIDNGVQVEKSRELLTVTKTTALVVTLRNLDPKKPLRVNARGIRGGKPSGHLSLDFDVN